MLLGEGKDDKVIFDALLAHLHIQDVQVESYDGKEKLATFLEALKVFSGFSNVTKLIVTRDANGDAGAALDSVGYAVSHAAFPNSLTVKILILPGGGQQGTLETLILGTISGHPIVPCMDAFFDCARKAGLAKHDSLSKQSKARVHAWLATQDTPNLRLGHAVQKGLVDLSSPALASLRQSLTDFF